MCVCVCVCVCIVLFKLSCLMRTRAKQKIHSSEDFHP